MIEDDETRFLYIFDDRSLIVLFVLTLFVFSKLSIVDFWSWLFNRLMSNVHEIVHLVFDWRNSRSLKSRIRFTSYANFKLVASLNMFIRWVTSTTLLEFSSWKSCNESTTSCSLSWLFKSEIKISWSRHYINAIATFLTNKHAKIVVDRDEINTFKTSFVNLSLIANVWLHARICLC